MNEQEYAKVEDALTSETSYQDREWQNQCQRMLRELGSISNQLSSLCTKMVQENKVSVKQVAALSLAISQISTMLFNTLKRLEKR